MKPHSPSRRLSGLTATGALVLAVSGVAAGGAQAATPHDPTTDAPVAHGRNVSGSVLVRFAGAPLATSSEVDRRSDDKVMLSGSHTRSVSADLAAQRNAFRSWLRSNAPKAKITSEYDFALNAVAVRLNGTPASALSSGPDVVEVTPESTYHPTAHEDPDLQRIDGLAGWTAAGATSSEGDPSTWAGYGVKVGVIDTGIDVTHPCFDDTGFPKTNPLGDPRLTNNKVIAARVFNNKLPQSGYDATAVQDHGTHVAGTVACDLHTPAVVEGAEIPYDPSGVAPGAQLGSYVVFPGDVEDARSEDILNAMQAAARDGMDVLNLSLGGGSNGKQDLLTMAADNLDRAAIVVAISAGNEGPGPATIGSPGMAERALTAGASTVGHYVGVPISSGDTPVTVAATGEFPVPQSDLTAPLGVVKDGDALSKACAALPADSLTDEIALVSRGDCTFATKVANASDAGAAAVIVVNNIPGDPTAMAGAGDIPAVMAPLAAKDALMALDGKPVTIGSTATYERSGYDDVLASFSSRGPVDVTARVKPDVVAPGVNVLSSVPASDCAGEDWVAEFGCWAFFQGTSMASPHLAGMAAVVLQAHPDWQSWQVRSAIINTADQDGVLQADGTTPETNVQYVGAGLAQLDSAVDAQVALSRPSISFGAVPSGSGKTLKQSVSVTNLSGGPLTLPVSVTGPEGAGTFSADPQSLTLGAGETKTVTVTLAVPKGADAGATQAILELGTVAHAALYAYVK